MYLRPNPPLTMAAAARYLRDEKKNMMSCSNFNAAQMENDHKDQAVSMVLDDF